MGASPNLIDQPCVDSEQVGWQHRASDQEQNNLVTGQSDGDQKLRPSKISRRIS